MTRKERLVEALIANCPWAIGVVIVAGIVHILSILAMPRLAPRDAFARVERLAAAHRMVLLPAAGADPTAPPFEDPALVQGVCRYDLAQGPLRLRADLPPDALTLFSFHARFGQLYYSMTDRSATRGKLDVLLLTAEQLDAVEANDSEDELPEELRIVAPTLEGYVLARALAERPGDVPDARRRVMATTCALAPSLNP